MWLAREDRAGPQACPCRPAAPGQQQQYLAAQPPTTDKAQRILLRGRGVARQSRQSSRTGRRRPIAASEPLNASRNGSRSRAVWCDGGHLWARSVGGFFFGFFFLSAAVTGAQAAGCRCLVAAAQEQSGGGE